MIGKTIKSVEDGTRRVKIVGLRKEGEEISLIPDASTAIGAGDLLVVIGERGELKKLSATISA